MPQRTEVCFVFLRSWFKSAVNLAIEEQVSQAVESIETLLVAKQNIRPGLTAHLPNFGVC